jgi:Cd2+/Zn2+-exporting ATPase
VSQARVLAVAAACEQNSEHALARASVAAANGADHASAKSTGANGGARAAAESVADADADGPLTAERFRPITGRGVRADIEGRTYFVGRPDLLGAHAAEPALTAAVAKLEEQGKTVVVVGTVDEPLGVIAVADPVRAGAGEALQALRAQGVEHIVMLTGDNEPTAQAIGRQVGVDEVRAGLLPEDKVDAVRDLGEHYGPTAMVGDGVNDAPALAAAGLGIAMGAAGTDAALETADVALMGDDLAGVAGLMGLSRRTRRIVAQNIAVSVAIKSVFLVLAPLGLVTLWLAVFADMGTSLAVIGNGLRLRR